MSEPATNAEREQAILDAASALITHYGYDKTTVEDMAQQAGVAKGTLYLHFRSKDDLFSALIAREAQRVAERSFALIDADPEGVTVYTIFRYGWQAMQENPLLRAVYVRDRRVLGDYVRRLASLPQFSQMVSLSGEFIQHFQRLGLIRDDLDPDALLYVLTSFRYGLLVGDAVVPLSRTSVDTVGEVISKLLASGIGPQGDAAKSEEGLRILRDLYAKGLEFMRANGRQASKDSNPESGTI